MFKAFLLILLALFSAPAVAYIGPGAGISVLGSLMGILVTVFVAIGAIVLWPLRKILKKRRNAAQGETRPAETSRVPDSPPPPGDQG